MANHPIVYSPGKSGSTTVMKAIQSAGLDAHRGYPANIQSLPYRDVPVIVLIREPLARAISELWENRLSFGRPIQENEYEYDLVTEQAIKDTSWLDRDFKPYFGTNFLGKRFNRERGWSVYGRFLVIRTDKLSSELPFALSKLFGLRSNEFDAIHRAIGEKRFGNEYRDYLIGFGADVNLLEELYRTKYCKHFWYKRELKEFAENWSR